MMRTRLVVPLLVAIGQALLAQPPTATARFTVVGTVVDSARSPLMGAEIRLVVGDSLLSLTRTASDGRFTLLVETGAPAQIRARRMGFVQRIVEISFPRDPADTLVVVLAGSPASLAEIEVVGQEEEMAGWLREFYQRRRGNSFGRFFTREGIQNAGKHQTSELLRLTPGVTLTPGRRFGYMVRMRGCRDAPMIWLDGTRLPGAELDDVTKPEDIAAMEVYTSTAGVPVQFMDRSNRGCGTIIVWTRHR